MFCVLTMHTYTQPLFCDDSCHIFMYMITIILSHVVIYLNHIINNFIFKMFRIATFPDQLYCYNHSSSSLFSTSVAVYTQDQYHINQKYKLCGTGRKRYIGHACALSCLFIRSFVHSFLSTWGVKFLLDYQLQYPYQILPLLTVCTIQFIYGLLNKQCTL